MKVTAWLPKEPEPVFKAHSTGELSGTHRRLIRSALSDDEIRCLIVSPIWEAQEVLFGIRAEPASYAVAVTENQFVISKDSPRELSPKIIRIPFHRIVRLELGFTLLTGRVVLHFLDNERRSALPLLYPANGTFCFAAAIREYRSKSISDHNNPLLDYIPGDDGWRRLEFPQRQAIEAIMTHRERRLRSTYWAEHWTISAGFWSRRPACTAPASLILLTDRGIIRATRQAPAKPKAPRYGLRITSIPWNYSCLRDLNAPQSKQGIY
jgi:hypothetical protein